MSVQFGRWAFADEPLDEPLSSVEAALAPYGPDGIQRFVTADIQLIYASLQTTRESHNETQPHRLPSGALLVWDGRLDNRDELLSELQMPLPAHAPDGALVAAAYERWQLDSLPKLLGDWALALLDPQRRTLVLAKDFLGTRPLHYILEEHRITWCSILDPLLAGRSLQVEEEYLAGWLSHLPAYHLTPFAGIISVPPASLILVKAGRAEIRRYWNFTAEKSIRYRTDRSYEDHFRLLLEQAVRRCLRSDRPVLAELSGGMDSSSIVCVADLLVRTGSASAPRLDTVSYFDDSDPDWNERPYFESVERQRGYAGLHLAVDLQSSLPTDHAAASLAPTPAAPARETEARRLFSEALLRQGNRILLSGTGGDEVLGGVPAPVPELADLLVRLRLGGFHQQLAAWALAQRTTLLRLAGETCKAFLPVVHDAVWADWLDPGFVERHRSVLAGYPVRLKWFGPRPSFQANLQTLEALRRQLACCLPSAHPPYEIRYPLLDRDLLEFLFAIPREQLLRPRQRRSLMRRALVGLVPDEILGRRRKAFVSRGRMAAIAREWPRLSRVTENMVSASLGIVDSHLFAHALSQAGEGEGTKTAYLIRTLAVEFWLRYLVNNKMWFCREPVLTGPSAAHVQRRGHETSAIYSGRQRGAGTSDSGGRPQERR
jgi:asparagine synthase (glutamine-hydrolysing)